MDDAIGWRNTRQRYGLVAIGLHWTIAAAILAMIGLGLIMTELDPSPRKFALYQWHKSIGITILALSLIRLGWRLANPVPALPEGMRAWEVGLARLTHVAFYVLMLALPVSGWLMVSVSPWNIPTVLYGVVELPHLPVAGLVEDRKSAESWMKEVHQWLAFGLVGLLLLHVAGALKHHLIAGDDVLRRMLPWSLRQGPQPPP